MSMQYCHTCGKNIDTDYDAEHFIDSECAEDKTNIEEIKHWENYEIQKLDGSWTTVAEVIKDQVEAECEEAIRGFADMLKMGMKMEKQMRCGDGTGKIQSHSTICRCRKLDGKMLTIDQHSESYLQTLKEQREHE